MAGIITVLPPLIEQPPGNNSSNPAGLPGVTYTFALLGLGQTWTALQTFPQGNISIHFQDIIGLSPSASVDTTNAANITSGTLPAGRLPAPTATTLGGIESIAAVSHKWLNSISTAGVPTLTQPDATDITFTQTGTGAVTVSSDAIWRNTLFTPEMFGAVGNGTTDDTAAIQRAVTAAAAAVAVVQFGPKTYKITSTITIANSAVSLRGSSIGLGTIILFAPTANGAALWWTSGAAINSYGGIYDLTVSSADTAFAKTGVRLTDFSDFTMRNVRIAGMVGGPSMTVTGAASNGASNEIRLTVNSTTGIPTPFAVNVSGVLGTTEANHSWKAVVIDATHIDLKGSTFTNAWSSGGTQVAQAASIACFTEGRELGTFDNTEMSGDIGLRIGMNPNEANGGLDATNFNNSTITGTGTGSDILVDDGVILSTISFTGYQSHGEGKDEFRFISKSDAAIHSNIYFENTRQEQNSVTGGRHFTFQTASNIYGLAIHNAQFDVDGLLARNTKNLVISGCYGLGTANTIDIDATVENTTLIGNYWIPGSTANIVGQTLFWAGAIVSGAPLPSSAQYGNSSATSNNFGPTTFNGSTRTVGQALFGLAGSANGSMAAVGLTSGSITIQPQNVAGTYNFNLPTSAGSAGQPMLSGGGAGAPMTFGTLAAANGGTGYTGGAWTTFTPAVTAQTGTFTTVSAAGAFIQIGKWVTFNVSITCTTVGTAAGNAIVQLPVGTAFRNFVTAGVETLINGNTLNSFCLAGSSNLNVRKYDSTTAIVTGAVLTVSGTYETS